MRTASKYTAFPDIEFLLQKMATMQASTPKHGRKHDLQLSKDQRKLLKSIDCERRKRMPRSKRKNKNWRMPKVCSSQQLCSGIEARARQSHARKMFDCSVGCGRLCCRAARHTDLCSLSRWCTQELCDCKAGSLTEAIISGTGKHLIRERMHA